VCNALVRLTAHDKETEVARATNRAQADFIAHLIATSGKAPQTCARRRAEPAEAISAYRAVSRPAACPQTVSRWL
jgi:hypothetical protein